MGGLLHTHQIAIIVKWNTTHINFDASIQLGYTKRFLIFIPLNYESHVDKFPVRLFTLFFTWYDDCRLQVSHLIKSVDLTSLEDHTPMIMSNCIADNSG